MRPRNPFRRSPSNPLGTDDTTLDEFIKMEPLAVAGILEILAAGPGGSEGAMLRTLFNCVCEQQSSRFSIMTQCRARFLALPSQWLTTNVAALSNFETAPTPIFLDALQDDGVPERLLAGPRLEEAWATGEWWNCDFPSHQRHYRRGDVPVVADNADGARREFCQRMGIRSTSETIFVRRIPRPAAEDLREHYDVREAQALGYSDSEIFDARLRRGVSAYWRRGFACDLVDDFLACYPERFIRRRPGQQRG